MTEDLMEWLKENGYQNLRVLADGTIVGTLDLMFTRSLVIDLDRWGWGHRYCYEQRILADAACAMLDSGDDQPLPGYVAERHRDPPKETP